MKVYFHKFYTEAHRRWQRGAAFANALEAAGIEVSLVLDSSCQLALCGAVHLAAEFDELMQRHDVFLRTERKPGCRRVHLCWDLYPIHTQGTRTGMTDCDREVWRAYQDSLLHASMIIAPSTSSAQRMRETLQPQGLRGKVRVVLAACDPWWEKYTVPCYEHHVMDVMRSYDDWGNGLVKRICDAHQIPCVVSRGELSFQEFQRAVANAKILVCAYDEASTGGLTLLEGYALGKQVLVSDSPWNGAVDYFGNKATYFRRGNEGSLVTTLLRMWQEPPPPCPHNADWVRHNYSDSRMAKNIADLLRELV